MPVFLEREKQGKVGVSEQLFHWLVKTQMFLKVN